MDDATRNATIRALAAASAAEIRMRPARALRMHAAVAGEILDDSDPLDVEPRCTDRDLPIDRARNRYTGKLRGEP